MFKIAFITFIALVSVDCCNSPCLKLNKTDELFVCKRLEQTVKLTQHFEEFMKIADNVTEFDEKYNALCLRNSRLNALQLDETKELMEMTSYKLKKPLEGFTESDLVIFIRHRVLFVYASAASPILTPQKYFAETRVLPTFVETREAKYTLEEGVLQVTIPGKANADSCRLNIDEEVITVPVFKLFSGSIVRRIGETS